MIVDEKKDLNFFKRILKRKKVVLIGRGETGGKIVGKFFTELKINFINTHSKTPEADQFFKEADILISAVGKKSSSQNTLNRVQFLSTSVFIK